MPSTPSQQPSLKPEKENSREIQQQNDDKDYPQRMRTLIQRELASLSDSKVRLA
ncbi:hypothetical protein FOCG_13852 [Fusarium oxysporum f. sp. radicis-lycopersici 26381]|nr:hypothetical protein FOCG_13852 [Fusarium oxysporum f. sp. radicis-lycopersici 26381]